MTTGPQGNWFDAGANYSFTPMMGMGNERWQGTVLLKTPTGNVLSMVSNGTLNNALTIILLTITSLP